MFLKIVYAANILVAGWVGVSCLFFPKTAAQSVFSGVYSNQPAFQLIGALWLAIALCSLAGLFRPMDFAPVLAIQLVYKSLWLLVVALPSIMNSSNYPKPLALFFLIWVLVLPWVIPWRHWWG